MMRKILKTYGPRRWSAACAGVHASNAVAEERRVGTVIWFISETSKFAPKRLRAT
ncbi:MAG TPA: hypothetical protein VEJ37_12635 [Xanthobacteraceae bacterium]|nr:hypothetical protein [Xanthobacteraceae bacterium]